MTEETKPDERLIKLLGLCKDVRKAQNHYFSVKKKNPLPEASQAALLASKKAEELLDAYVEALQAELYPPTPTVVQSSLF